MRVAGKEPHPHLHRAPLHPGGEASGGGGGGGRGWGLRGWHVWKITRRGKKKKPWPSSHRWFQTSARGAGGSGRGVGGRDERRQTIFDECERQRARQGWMEMGGRSVGGSSSAGVRVDEAPPQAMR